MLKFPNTGAFQVPVEKKVLGCLHIKGAVPSTFEDQTAAIQENQGELSLLFHDHELHRISCCFQLVCIIEHFGTKCI